MKMIKSIIPVLAFLLLSLGSYAQNPENWSSKQLMEPAVLAKAIETSKPLPVIISVGPGANIPTSIHVGLINTPEGLAKLRKELTPIARNKKVLIYCGCCPFDHCPNVRPAIAMLKELKFTDYYLLNIPNNIRKDWIDKGYPVSKS